LKRCGFLIIAHHEAKIKVLIHPNYISDYLTGVNKKKMRRVTEYDTLSENFCVFNHEEARKTTKKTNIMLILATFEVANCDLKTFGGAEPPPYMNYFL
jgi:hypothetical protein